MEVGPLYTQSGSLHVLSAVHVGLENGLHRFRKTKNQIYVLVENRGLYGASKVDLVAHERLCIYYGNTS